MYYLNSYKEDYWAWAQGFSVESCNELVSNFTSNELQQATLRKGDLDLEKRNSRIFWVPTDSSTASLYEHLTNAIKSVNDLFFQYEIEHLEHLQFTQYSVDNPHFHRHLDMAMGDNKHRKLSFSVQLSDPNSYEGGDLQLHYTDKPVTVSRQQGIINFFPSWLLHEVTPVTSGTRYSLVGWVRGPRFK
jgi:PKHD-type hydroxylase